MAAKVRATMMIPNTRLMIGLGLQVFKATSENSLSMPCILKMG